MIDYAESVRGVEARDLDGFFVDWPHPPSPERHLDLLRGSDHVVLAHENGRVVGFVTDLCDADLEPFYRRLGLQTWDRGMGIRNREALRR